MYKLGKRSTRTQWPLLNLNESQEAFVWESPEFRGYQRRPQQRRKDRTECGRRIPVEALKLWIDKITVEFSVILFAFPLTSSARLWPFRDADMTETRRPPCVFLNRHQTFSLHDDMLLKCQIVPSDYHSPFLLSFCNNTSACISLQYHVLPSLID